EVGIIIITESVADMMRSTVEKYLFTVSFPLIVEIPDRTSTKAGRTGIREMVNAAIGLKL
ncbi:MAG: V-type ATP synthase subunit F, partial [Planctomycetota bacterium]